MATTSQKQIEANRRNAQKSTGPATPAGKQAAKFNALKHGMAAKSAVLPYEDAAIYADLRHDLIEQYRPAAGVEVTLVDTIANAYWRLIRIRRVETSLFDLRIQTLKMAHDRSTTPRDNDDEALAVLFSKENIDPTATLERYTEKIERCYFKGIETLRRVQKERLRQEQADARQQSENGFVRRQRIDAAKQAGFAVTETEHAHIIHIVTPSNPRTSREESSRHPEDHVSKERREDRTATEIPIPSGTTNTLSQGRMLIDQQQQQQEQQQQQQR